MDSLATLQVYKELADWYERQGQPAMRDRFLILAAEAAFSGGKTDEAERLRQRLLLTNPHHMLKPFNSFAQALQSTNVQIYIHDLQVNYPPETAENLLRNLHGGSGEVNLDVPQTAPLFQLADEPTLPLVPAAEPPKVIPLRAEPPPKLPSPLPIKPTQFDRPATRKPTTGSMPTGKAPRPAAAARSMRPLTPRDTYASSGAEESAAAAGSWLTYLLFGMTVTAGVALAVYTLARPFLPAGWLP